MHGWNRVLYRGSKEKGENDSIFLQVAEPVYSGEGRGGEGRYKISCSFFKKIKLKGISCFL
jgi:hypothetical protein